MERFLLALLHWSCALFQVNADTLARKDAPARSMTPESFGR